jgi:hypothetical protein
MSLYDLVSGQMTNCQKYADDAFEEAQDYLETLQEQVLEPFDPIEPIDYTWPEPTLEWTDIYRPERPEGLDMPDRDEPEDAETGDIEVPDFPEIPPFSDEKPVVTYPGTPDRTMPDPVGEIPPIDEIDIPVSPELYLPDPPSFDQVVIPGDPNIAFPYFDAEPPLNDLVPPENAFIYSEAMYSSELGEALRQKILGVLVSGGTGLGAEVEVALWNQAKLRTESENARLYNEALTFWSSRGWSIPPGALDGRLFEASVEQERALADINEKILIEQARLAQEMEKFITQSGLQYEQQVMNYSNELQNRAFQAAKATVELAIALFQSKVAWYNAQMDAYKTMAAVYEIRIRAELGKVEVFKAQLEAARLQVDINQAEIQLYLAQLQGATVLVDLYKTQMQAAALHAEINRLKLDMFKTQVEAYQVQVQSKVAEFDLYKAELSGEQLKVQVFSELVRAYATQIDGLKAGIEAKTAIIGAQVAVNKDKIDIMLAHTERYKALLTADTEKVKTVAAVYEVEGRLYSSDIQLASADVQAQVEVYRGRLSRAKNETDILLKEAEMNLQSFIQNRQLAIEAAKAGAQVCAQLAASSLSAVHAGANIGYSGQESTSLQESKSVSTSEQTVYQHVFQES